MIRTLTRWLTVGATKRRERQLRDARNVALTAYDDACNRGDTRDQGRSLMILRQATHDALAASLSASQQSTRVGGSR